MLDATMTQQLKTYLENLREPIELVASLGDDDKSVQTRELLEEIAALHEKVSASFDGTDDRKPSFIIRRASDSTKWVRFAGLPMGHEFTSLVLALLWAGGHPPKVEQEVIDQIAALEEDLEFEMYFSLSCHNCPDVVQALTLMALVNPRITATLIEGGTFKNEVENRDVMAVPATFLNGEPFFNGKMSLEEVLAKVDTGASAKAAEKLSAKDPFEVLVVGGGPGGVAASTDSFRVWPVSAALGSNTSTTVWQSAARSTWVKCARAVPASTCANCKRARNTCPIPATSARSVAISAAWSVFSDVCRFISSSVRASRCNGVRKSWAMSDDTCFNAVTDASCAAAIWFSLPPMCARSSDQRGPTATRAPRSPPVIRSSARVAATKSAVSRACSIWLIIASTAGERTPIRLRVPGRSAASDPQ